MKILSVAVALALAANTEASHGGHWAHAAQMSDEKFNDASHGTSFRVAFHLHDLLDKHVADGHDHEVFHGMDAEAFVQTLGLDWHEMDPHIQKQVHHYHDWNFKKNPSERHHIHLANFRKLADEEEEKAALLGTDEIEEAFLEEEEARGRRRRRRRRRFKKEWVDPHLDCVRATSFGAGGLRVLLRGESRCLEWGEVTSKAKAICTTNDSGRDDHRGENKWYKSNSGNSGKFGGKTGGSSSHGYCYTAGDFGNGIETGRGPKNGVATYSYTDIWELADVAAAAGYFGHVWKDGTSRYGQLDPRNNWEIDDVPGGTYAASCPTCGHCYGSNETTRYTYEREDGTTETYVGGDPYNYCPQVGDGFVLARWKGDPTRCAIGYRGTDGFPSDIGTTAGTGQVINPDSVSEARRGGRDREGEYKDKYNGWDDKWGHGHGRAYSSAGTYFSEMAFAGSGGAHSQVSDVWRNEAGGVGNWVARHAHSHTPFFALIEDWLDGNTTGKHPDPDREPTRVRCHSLVVTGSSMGGAAAAVAYARFQNKFNWRDTHDIRLVTFEGTPAWRQDGECGEQRGWRSVTAEDWVPNVKQIEHRHGMTYVSHLTGRATHHGLCNYKTPGWGSLESVSWVSGVDWDLDRYAKWHMLAGPNGIAVDLAQLVHGDDYDIKEARARVDKDLSEEGRRPDCPNESEPCCQVVPPGDLETTGEFVSAGAYSSGGKTYRGSTYHLSGVQMGERETSWPEGPCMCSEQWESFYAWRDGHAVRAIRYDPLSCASVERPLSDDPS